MKKRLGFALVFCFAILATALFTGCGVNEIKELTVVGNAYNEFVVGESYDYKNISVNVVFNDDTKFEDIKGNDDRITITGFSTATPGTRNLTLTFSDGKTSSSCEIPYTVYSNAQVIKTATDIDKITTQTKTDDNGVLFFPYSGTFDLAGKTIKRDLTIVARKTAKVTLINVKISHTSAKKDLQVSFNNIKFTNGAQYDGTNATAVAATILYVTPSESTYKCDLTLTRCSFVADGIVYDGIILPSKGRFEITESEFVTPTANDLFTRLIECGLLRMDEETLIKKNTFICNFSYGFMAIYNATIEDNYVEATLTAAGIGDRAINTNSQKNFVSEKNPIFLHIHIPSTFVRNVDNGEKALYLHVKNNIINNVQNFVRVYELDKHNYEEEIDFDFAENKLKNVAVLVNTSQISYASLTNVLADIRAGITADSVYVREYKAVIEKDTEIEITRNMTVQNVEQVGGFIYYDFNDANENVAEMIINNESYIYVAQADRLTDKVSAKCYVIKEKEGDTYYIITAINYSPSGDIPVFMSDKGTSRNIADAKVFTELEVKELLGLESILG